MLNSSSRCICVRRERESESENSFLWFNQCPLRMSPPDTPGVVAAAAAQNIEEFGGSFNVKQPKLHTDYTQLHKVVPLNVSVSVSVSVHAH